MKHGRFEVGDRVAANALSNGRYAITCLAHNWAGVVTKVQSNYDIDGDDDDIWVMEDVTGKEFMVCHKFFELINPAGKIVKDSGIKKVIFHDPATIVFWKDGTKTVVKTNGGDKFDKEKGLAMAIAKKFFGNTYDYYGVFKKWVKE